MLRVLRHSWFQIQLALLPFPNGKVGLDWGLKEDTYIKVMGENADLFQHQLESYSFQQQPESHFISHRAARRLLLTKVATCLLLLQDYLLHKNPGIEAGPGASSVLSPDPEYRLSSTRISVPLLCLSLNCLHSQNSGSGLTVGFGPPWAEALFWKSHCVPIKHITSASPSP